MRYRQRQKHSIDSLITLVLFGVFASCVLGVLLTGAKAYRNLTAKNREAYDHRTCIQYVATKVRQAPSGDCVGIERMGGIDSLSFTEEIDGEPYITRVYCYDGWIRELFTFAGADFAPEEGEKVIEAQEMRLRLSGDLLTVEITDEGGEIACLHLTLRGKEGI